MAKRKAKVTTPKTKMKRIGNKTISGIYVLTDSATKEVKAVSKNRLNISGLVVSILYNNLGTWMTKGQILAEMAKDLAQPNTHTVNTALMDLSGNRPNIIAAAQRNDIVRRAVTQSGVHGRTVWEYRFNTVGAQRTRHAKQTSTHSMVSTAVFNVPGGSFN